MRKTRFFLGITILLSVIIGACIKEVENSEGNIDDSDETNVYQRGAIPSKPSSLLLIPLLDTTELFKNLRIQKGENIMDDFPPSFFLDMPIPQNQGSESSCVAFACAYAARSYMLHKNNNLSYFIPNSSSAQDNRVLFSPEFLYNNTKASGDCSTGTYIDVALNFMKNKGVITWEEMKYSDKNGCEDIGNTQQRKNAEYFKISEYYRISGFDVEYYKRIVTKGFPIIIGVMLDEGFNTIGSKIWRKRSGKDIGLHAMVICGFDDSKNAFKVMNSWGSDWGDGGFAWIDYKYLPNVIWNSSYDTIPKENNSGLLNVFVIGGANDSSLLSKVTTMSVKNATNSSVTVIGKINSYGTGLGKVFQFGICYSKNEEPSVDDYNVQKNNLEELQSSGMFEVVIENLEKNTTYYARAYAISEYGIGYGNQLEFGTIHEEENSNFYLSDNGITIKCPAAQIGEKGIINGIVYTKRTIDQITIENASTSCVSGITNMKSLFENKKSFNQDIGSWDVSEVTNMAMMFRNASNFNQDISKWDVSNVTNMNDMFNGTTRFNQDLSKWCVKKIQSEPEDFSVGSGFHSNNKPKWGTCGEGSSNTTSNPYLNPDLEYGSVTDIDGNEYPTIKIGNQVWMAENLRTTRFNNGAKIQHESDNLEWSKKNTNSVLGAAWCYPDNDETTNRIYGKLYNAPVVNYGNACPIGWHVATSSEWGILQNSFPTNTRGPKMASGGSSLWDLITVVTSNESGMTILPTGFRDKDGIFRNRRLGGFWWTNNYIYEQLIANGLGTLAFSSGTPSSSNNGLSIRCIKD